MLPKLKPPELTPELPSSRLPGETILLIDLDWGPVNGNVPQRGINLGATDGDYLPIVKVQPNYPRRAQQQGIEGYAIVQFDVGADGSVRNAHIIESAPGSKFNAASIKAALCFRYKPRVDNGIAVTVFGVENKFTYKLSMR